MPIYSGKLGIMQPSRRWLAIIGSMQTIDLYARDVTGIAERQRGIDRRRLVRRVALVTFLLTAALIWLTM